MQKLLADWTPQPPAPGLGFSPVESNHLLDGIMREIYEEFLNGNAELKSYCMNTTMKRDITFGMWIAFNSCMKSLSLIQLSKKVRALKCPVQVQDNLVAYLLRNSVQGQVPVQWSFSLNPTNGQLLVTCAVQRKRPYLN